MGILAGIFGTLGGLCAVMGIITATGKIPSLGTEFTAMFWLTLGAVLLLGSIACAVSRGDTYES